MDPMGFVLPNKRTVSRRLLFEKNVAGPKFRQLLLRRMDIPQKRWMGFGENHQPVQVPKMEVLNLIRLFWGMGFPLHKPYIQLI